MLGYLTADIPCSSKLTVFLDTFAENYASRSRTNIILPHQMDAILYLYTMIMMAKAMRTEGFCSFGVIWIRISDIRSLGSYCIKGTDESMTRVGSSIPLMHHDPSDLESLILIKITDNNDNTNTSWSGVLQLDYGLRTREYTLNEKEALDRSITVHRNAQNCILFYYA